MSERINLAELRKQLTISSRTGEPYSDDFRGAFDWDLTDIWCDDVLALVEVVEAAHWLSEGAASPRLDSALARFDFGENE